MSHSNDKALLVKALSGKRLAIPDMRQFFSHWPRGVNECYQAKREILERESAPFLTNEKVRKLISQSNPGLLAAMWWPTSSWKQYRVMTDLIIWFILWDDMIEKLVPGSIVAEEIRDSTKGFVKHSLGLGAADENETITKPLIQGFRGIADEVCHVYDEDQRRILCRHFEEYIDATKLEAEADRSEAIPSLEKYWEVRILTSGMGTFLGFSEFALKVKLPLNFVCSQAYNTLWVTTIVINSVVNDLISFKKEMREGSVLSSVAILYQQSNDLDLAVQTSLDHLKRCIESFDRTAADVLSSGEFDVFELDAVSKVIDLMRTVNTGNLEWSLQAARYDVAQHMTEAGQIELVL